MTDSVIPPEALHLIEQAKQLFAESRGAREQSRLLNLRAEEVEGKAATIIAKATHGMEIGDTISWQGTQGWKKPIAMRGVIESFELAGNRVWARVRGIKTNGAIGVRIRTCYYLEQAKIEEKAHA